jgi:PAS domain S-box-containing protein
MEKPGKGPTIEVAERFASGDYTSRVDEHDSGNLGSKVNRLGEALEARSRMDLRDVDETVRTFIEYLPDATLLTNRDGEVVLANSHACDLFGYEPGELLGASVDILIPTDSREAHLEHRKAFVAAPSHRPMGQGLELHSNCKHSAATANSSPSP